MNKTKELVLLKKSESNPHIAIVTLNRADAGNALSTEMLKRIAEVLDQIQEDLSIRAVILRSAGKHSGFGADLNGMVIENDGVFTNQTREVIEQHISDGRDVAEKIFNLRVPIIGIIHGYCLGGTAEFFTLCDRLYGAEGEGKLGTMYGFPEITIGCMPGWMGPETLINLIDVQDARDLLYTGKTINAEEAWNIGIVQELHPKDDLLGKAMEWAGQVAANAPFAAESTRRTINNVLHVSFEEFLETTGEETVDNMLTADFVLGAEKIIKKRKNPLEFSRN